eukprot:1073609-Rhodomonas_salina.1
MSVPQTLGTSIPNVSAGKTAQPSTKQVVCYRARVAERHHYVHLVAAYAPSVPGIAYRLLPWQYRTQHSRSAGRSRTRLRMREVKIACKFSCVGAAPFNCVVQSRVRHPKPGDAIKIWSQHIRRAVLTCDTARARIGVHNRLHCAVLGLGWSYAGAVRCPVVR